MCFHLNMYTFLIKLKRHMMSSQLWNRSLIWISHYSSAGDMCIRPVESEAFGGHCCAFLLLRLRAEHCWFSSLFWGMNMKSMISICAPSLWVGGCAVCGVTIARSNASRMDPNHKMFSAQHVSPPGQGRIWVPVKSTSLVSLKSRCLGNTCS